MEGALLERTQHIENSLGVLFSHIEVSLQGLNKASSELIKYEWNSATYPLGRIASCFRIKHACNPSDVLVARIAIQKSSMIRPRYEASESLKAFLPTLCDDPTEDDILTMMWTYIVSNNLIEGREKKTIRCDAALKKLFSTDGFTSSSLKHRVKQHLTFAKAIRFDYILAPETAVDLSR
jgi:chromatin remodeling complex protein RSC6